MWAASRRGALFCGESMLVVARECSKTALLVFALNFIRQWQNLLIVRYLIIYRLRSAPLKFHNVVTTSITRASPTAAGLPLLGAADIIAPEVNAFCTFFFFIGVIIAARSIFSSLSRSSLSGNAHRLFHRSLCCAYVDTSGGICEKCITRRCRVNANHVLNLVCCVLNAQIFTLIVSSAYPRRSNYGSDTPED